MGISKDNHEDRIQIAFVGCGHIAHVHAHFLSKLGRKVSAVCDTSITRAKLFAEQYAIPKTYTDLAGMISIPIKSDR